MAQFSVPEVEAELRRQAPLFDVLPEYAIALFRAENSASGDIKSTTAKGDAVSEKGASGVMQVMPATARGLQKAGLLPPEYKFDPNNLSSQVMAGLAAIKDVQGRMKNPNDLYELGAGYNGSPAVHKAYNSNKPIPAETANYLQKLQVAANNLGLNIGAPNMADLQLSPSASVPITGATTTADSGDSSSTTSRSSTKTNVFDPAALKMFSDMIMGAVQPQGSIDQTANLIMAGGQQRRDAASALATAITAKADAAGEEASISALRDATAATRKTSILTQLNLNPDFIANEMVNAADVINKTDAALLAMRPEIDSRMNVGMYDNPVEWFINQTRLPSMVGTYNSVIDQQRFATDRYKTLTTLADTQAKLSTGMDADLIAKEGLAKAARIAAGAKEDLAKLQYDNISATTRDALTIAHLTGTKVELAGRLLATSRETNINSESDNEKAAAKAADQRDLDNVNRILVAGGASPIESVRALNSLPAAKRELLRSAASSGKFGKNFAESFDYVSNYGDINTIANKGGAAVKIWYDGTLRSVGQQVKDEATKAKAAGQKFDANKRMEELLNEKGALYQAQASDDMRTADSSNPFKLAYTTLAKMPELANNPLAIFINTYGPSGKEPRFDKVDEQYIMQRFGFSVASGKMPMQDAVKAITEFYKVAEQQQILNTSALMFGLSKPATTYTVKLNTPRGILSRKDMTVDLGDPVAVENFITNTVAMKAIASNQLMGTNTNPMGDNPASMGQ